VSVENFKKYNKQQKLIFVEYNGAATLQSKLDWFSRVRHGERSTLAFSNQPITD